MSGVLELGKEELKEVDGGANAALIREIIKGIAIGVGGGATVQLLAEWDDFKKGFASAFN